MDYLSDEIANKVRKELQYAIDTEKECIDIHIKVRNDKYIFYIHTKEEETLNG